MFTTDIKKYKKCKKRLIVIKLIIIKKSDNKIDSNNSKKMIKTNYLRLKIV